MCTFKFFNLKMVIVLFLVVSIVLLTSPRMRIRSWMSDYSTVRPNLKTRRTYPCYIIYSARQRGNGQCLAQPEKTDLAPMLYNILSTTFATEITFFPFTTLCH